MEFRNPATGDEIHDDAASFVESSPDLDILVEDALTPVKTSPSVDAQQLQQLHNESKTTISQVGSSTAQSGGSSTQLESAPAESSASPLPQSSSPPSRRSCESARNSSEWRVQRLTGVTTEMAPPEDGPSAFPSPGPTAQPGISDDESRLRNLSATRRGLQRLKLRRPGQWPVRHDADVPMASQDSPASRSLFRARRTREDVNWFSGSRAAKTLPLGFEPPESLRESSGSNSGSLRGQSSRSASLRLRNNRLPPAYALPHDQEALAITSASVPDCEVVGGRCPTGRLSLWPLDTSPGRQTASPLIPDPDGHDRFALANLDIPQRPARALTIDPTTSDALQWPDQALNRGSRFNELMGEGDAGMNPDAPPQSSDRPSTRDSDLVSNRGGAVIPDPVPRAEPETQATKPKSSQSDKTLWLKRCVLAVMWAAAFALTVLGVSRTSPLDQHTPACVLEQVHTCTPPSLSFMHNMWLNTTLPGFLHPYLHLMQADDVSNAVLTDRGINVSIQNGATSLNVRGGMLMNTLLANDKASLLSNITYVGIVDGDGDAKKARRKLADLMKKLGDARNGKTANVDNAQGVSRDVAVSKNGYSLGPVLSALWLGGLLAVEMTLLFYSAIVVLASCCWKGRDRAVATGEDGWRREVFGASGLALQLVLAGALGTVSASGILVAVWS